MAETNYYELLGVARDASPDEIKRAYRRLATKTHPDMEGSKGLFQLLGLAYETLADPGKRAAYDRGRANGSSNGHTPPPRDEPGPDRHEPDPTAAPPPPRRSRATVAGRVDFEAAADAFGARGGIGAAGETVVARELDQAELPDVAWILHSLQVTDRGSDVDHVVICGDRLLVIDSKAWAPGVYDWGADDGGGVWRNIGHGSERFQVGDPDRSHGVADKLIEGVADASVAVERLMVVAPSHGPVEGLDVARVRPPGITVLRVDQLAGWVGTWAAQMPSAPVDPGLLSRLVARVRRPDAVTTSLPSVPPLDGIDVTPPDRLEALGLAALSVVAGLFALSVSTVGPRLTGVLLLAAALAGVWRLATSSAIMDDIRGGTSSAAAIDIVNKTAVVVGGLAVTRGIVASVPLIGGLLAALIALAGIPLGLWLAWRWFCSGWQAVTSVSQAPASWDDLIRDSTPLDRALAANALRFRADTPPVRRLIAACRDAGGETAEWAERIDTTA